MHRRGGLFWIINHETWNLIIQMFGITTIGPDAGPPICHLGHYPRAVLYWFFSALANTYCSTLRVIYPHWAGLSSVRIPPGDRMRPLSKVYLHP